MGFRWQCVTIGSDKCVIAVFDESVCFLPQVYRRNDDIEQLFVHRLEWRGTDEAIAVFEDDCLAEQAAHCVHWLHQGSYQSCGVREDCVEINQVASNCTSQVAKMGWHSGSVKRRNKV